MAREINQALGLYVSVPFCRAKCSFCNFASGVASADAVEGYVAALCAEIDGAAELALRMGADLQRAVDTIYLGGGTPSLLQPAQLERIFAALRSSFDVCPGAEITLEAAPGQISDAVLETLVRLGVNRISLGVQSFVDRECAAVGRFHTRESCLREFARLGRAGIDDVGADLIAGLPYQTLESWEESLGVATSCGLSHLSIYMFEVDEDSRLGSEVMARGLRLHAPRVPGDDLVATMYEYACDVLPRTGYAQYEVSNFANTGRQSLHNRKYWERTPYMGFGLDAHSMLIRGEEAIRFANPDELSSYSGTESERIVTPVSWREAFEEEVFLGLRLVEGIDLRALRPKYPQQWIEEVKEAAHDVATEDLMESDGTTLSLTTRGRLLSNEVFGRLLDRVSA